jgi:hypothetical protein
MQGPLCINVNDSRSLHELSYWLEVAREGCSDNAVFIVIGCMIDRGDREVLESEGADFARGNSFLYFEVSAKTGEGVEAPLDTMLRAVIGLPCDRAMTTGDQAIYNPDHLCGMAGAKGAPSAVGLLTRSVTLERIILRQFPLRGHGRSVRTSRTPEIGNSPPALKKPDNLRN